MNPYDSVEHDWHVIDLLRVALQKRGASQVEIEQALFAVKKLASSEEAFNAWNKRG
jgi:hypothetical protein